MTQLVKLALARPYTVVVMATLILIFGVLAAVRSPIDIFPNIKVPVVAVVFSYNGLSPDDMAGRIVTYYERAVTTSVNDVEHIESQSLPNYGVIKIYFQPNVNINSALAEISAASQTVLKQMPPGITPPTVLSFNASSVPVLQLALSGASLPETTLFDQASSFIRPQLASVQGAAIPLPYGGKVRQVQADLNQEALRQYGLSADDISKALSLQNLITPVGTQKIGKLEYKVNLNDSPTVIAAFNDLPIKTVGGATIYMRDVAYVHDGSPPQTNAVRVDGANAVLLSVVKAGETSTLAVIKGVKSLLPQIEQTLPPGLTVTAVGDQSQFVLDAVNSVIREGVIAAALTGLMIILFLGSWRSTLIVTTTIPLSILASVAALSALGETINVMTLGGLALAVGILVDDATVTIENINRHLELGQDIRSAIVNGATEIIPPATVSLVCMCIAFVPMFGLGGVAGFLFRPMAEAVVFALIASYIMAQTVTPAMANALLRPHAPRADRSSRRPSWPARFQAGFERRFEALRERYRGLLFLALHHRRRVLIGFFGVSLGSMVLSPALGQDFFPAIDGGQIKIHMRAATGTRIEVSTRLADQIAAAVRQVIPADEIAGLVENVGLSVSGINMAYDNSGTIGVQDGDILITLRPHHHPTADYVKRLREVLPRRFPGVTFAFLPADMVTQILNFGTPAPIDLQVTGSNLDADRRYAETLLAGIQRIPGVADARIQQTFALPTLDVNVDRSYAGQVGVTERDAATSMLTTLAGSTQVSPTFWLNPKTGVSYPVSIQTPQDEIASLGGLQNLPVTGAGAAAPQLLGGLASIKRAVSDGVVSHYNVRPTIDIYAATQGRDLGAVAGAIRAVIKANAAGLPKGSTIALRGQVATMASAYGQLIAGLVFAIVLIYLVIVVNFQSWRDPAVIILALPTALAGIVWMLFATGTTLSVPALTGAIMCMGVATANSNLVIAFARERMAEGADPVTAALEAGATRFRPVLMTALAMIVGMLPMAIEPGENSPLGRAVIGGLMFATTATLFLVPTLFSLAHRRTEPAAAPEPSAPALPHSA